jgi:hypothetical protein
MRTQRQRFNNDEGSILVIILAFMVLGSVLVLPVLDRVLVAHRNGSTAHRLALREEATKGAVRVSLADPKALYQLCSNSAGPESAIDIPIPGIDVDMDVYCAKLKDTPQVPVADVRVPMTTTKMGSTAPVGTVGAPFVGDPTDPTAWVGSATAVSTGTKILLPDLPARSLKTRSANPFPMPVGACRVYFPGTYRDPIVISDATPVYFTSGVYYFENTLTVTGSANVVGGRGPIEGCATDQDAVFDIAAVGRDHGVTGNGVTFVFGAAGRLLVNNSVPGSGPTLALNDRLVRQDEVSVRSSKSVNIMTVNGTVTAGVTSDYSIPGTIHVPRSKVADPAVDPFSDGYVASSLTAVDPLAVAPAPVRPAVIDINFTTASAGSVYIPGYVSVPQGKIRIAAAPGQTAGKEVSMVGGVLSAEFEQSVDLPQTTQLGIINRIVQRTFKIVAKTTQGTPEVTSIAIVFINESGDFGVKSFYLL